MNDHSRHGAARAAREHRHDLDRAAEHAGHGQGHEHLGHVGHADVYRRRFWITLILAVPVVVYSEMIQDWFGFTAPQFTGDGLVAPVLGTVIFFYGGSVFLTGWSRRPSTIPASRAHGWSTSASIPSRRSTACSKTTRRTPGSANS